MYMQSRLYYDQPYMKEFDTEIEKIEALHPHGYRLILRETAFYPTSGGQPNDKGSIAGVPVFDVTEEDGIIYHHVAQAPQDRLVHCILDWERRFDFMQQHAGQHILSEAFLLHCQAATIGFHLTEDNLTIDLDIAELHEAQIHQVEDTANQMIWENRPILRHWVTPEELARLPLRKQPKVHENIRVIEVQDFDWSPCGGTHPASTGEIGSIKIRRWERSKGVTRVEFFCGKRALQDYRWKNKVVLALAQNYSVKDVELEEIVLRQQTQLKELDKRLQEVESSLLQKEAEALLQEAVPIQQIRIVKGVLSAERTLSDMKKMSFFLTQTPNTLVLLSNSALPRQFTFSRSSTINLSLNSTLKVLQKELGGKGGGSELLVQGSYPVEIAPDAYIERFLALVLPQ